MWLSASILHFTFLILILFPLAAAGAKAQTLSLSSMNEMVLIVYYSDLQLGVTPVSTACGSGRVMLRLRPARYRRRY